MSHHHTVPRHRIQRSFPSSGIPTNQDVNYRRRRYLGNPMRLKRKSPKAACLQMIAMLTICFIYFYFSNKAPTKCSLRDPFCPNSYFSDTYDEARDKFLVSSSKIHGSKTYNLPIVEIKNKTLFTDITVINSNANHSDHLIVHISGVYGIEAFVGSAVQCAILTKMAQMQSTINKTGKYRRTLMETMLVNEKNKKWINDSDEFPVVIMIHALNPFGMFYGSRTNENNVDLNMNLWDESSNNHICNAYDDELDEFLNPRYNIQHLMQNVHRFVPGARFFKLNWIIHWMYTYLINWHLKTKIYSYFVPNNVMMKIFQRYAVGQNYNKNGLKFVGYKEKEKSHVLLMEFLETKLELKGFKKVTFIDLHSGHNNYDDESYGKSRVSVADERDLKIVQNIGRKVRCSSLLHAKINTNMTRMIGQKYLELMSTKDALAIVHNFGTYSKKYMLNVVRFKHSYDIEYKQYLANNSSQNKEELKLMKYMKQYSSNILKEAYYVNDLVWRRNVIENGYDVFSSLYKR